MGSYREIHQIRREVERSGGHFFDEGTMAFWNSRVCCAQITRLNDDKNTRFFITAERLEWNDPERFTVRYVQTVDGKTTVSTIGKFMEHPDEGQALYALAGYMDAILDGLTFDTVVELASI